VTVDRNGDNGYPEVIHDVPQSVQGYYLDYATAMVFKILPNPSFIMAFHDCTCCKIRKSIKLNITEELHHEINGISSTNWADHPGNLIFTDSAIIVFNFVEKKLEQNQAVSHSLLDAKTTHLIQPPQPHLSPSHAYIALL
jgi:hypothetical protein